MNLNMSFFWISVAIAIAAGVWVTLRFSSGRPIPDIIRRGKPLPDFAAVDEQGDPVRSTDLHGTAVVLLFVRGNWCPFCTAQVEDLTRHYKSIVDLGARLILLTPKPLQTTRTVAEFFEVEFDFWLDESLGIARQLGIVEAGGVPEVARKEYGTDTVWPTALVVSSAGVIDYVKLGKNLGDRPKPEELLAAIRKSVAA